MILPMFDYLQGQAHLEATVNDSNLRVTAVTYRNLTSRTFRLDLRMSDGWAPLGSWIVGPGTPDTTQQIAGSLGLRYTAAPDGEGMDPNFDFLITTIA